MSTYSNLPLPQRMAASALEAGIPQLADQIGRLAVPLWGVRDELRELLLDSGAIVPVDAEPLGSEIAAVDGGTVTQAAYLGDLLVAMAFAAPGQQSSIDIDQPQYATCWTRFAAHQPDQDRLAKVAMMAGEVLVASRLPHDVVMLDGSFQSPVLAMTSVLSSQNPEVRRHAVDLLESWDVAAALARVCDPDVAGNVVACPKSDSDHTFIEWVASTDQLALPDHVRKSLTPLPDKVAAALLLEPGEMTAPQPTPRRWSEIRVRATEGDVQAEQVAAKLDAAAAPLRATPAATDKGVSVTYALPPGGVSAIKVEVPRPLGVDHAGKVVAALFTECHQPHILEPFPQVVADEWAKSVSDVANALHGGALHHLIASDDIDPQWLQLAALTHRTAR